MKKEKEVYLWDVYIIPNNQPTIEMGEYYAPTAKIAMEIAATDNQMSVDDNWAAVLKK